MPLKTIVVATDGSDAATRAAQAGLSILQPADRIVVVAAVSYKDPSALAGAGFAAGTMMPGEVGVLAEAHEERAQEIVERTARLLAPANIETQVLEGDAGPALCDFASELSANAIVMGSRGHRRFKRAFLGSVSDYVVRHAPCPVVVTGPGD